MKRFHVHVAVADEPGADCCYAHLDKYHATARTLDRACEQASGCCRG